MMNEKNMDLKEPLKETGVPVTAVPGNPFKIRISGLNLWYGAFQALKDINASFPENRITAIIGPSGCGKSTLLRVFNRMNDLVEGVRATGDVSIDGWNILDQDTDLVSLRKRVGMVFQRPNPFPLSIYENIVFGPRIHNHFSKPDLDEIVETSLRSVLLWDVLKDRLKESALRLSLEQRQRLCIARLIAVKPEILLMDEPCSTLDPKSTGTIEELMRSLKDKYTIIIVTHNMQQAGRISDQTAFLFLGDLIEMGPTGQIFTNPRHKKTEDYITGRFG